ncbi:glutamine--fructose-6-phosphate transaminase (isomerizing) [Candidatus Peregrinibacteria bacterium]|jgi:glutamine---fructose-6-phosphate transaminase (isomerizing)|nr:glutamine--fructose-6-phosphate transaminase (isomerizing) [Candidatus Peregrinibacteria bacterium]MBT4632147.1 glutamine--fructose-6-phosphate transaminase (isomerizing) [Candidatus Peregrinibacteria bacterium]MBT5517070.1 glutamine--fructose-6-phosphate transaminase (isomerizing) [Candidatus Peregrinibacteria bacterium]MBT5824065.1 glutamine--fructose-6-phosphate transaminase (isomerizing) [Candidatus Peregrinibacteria bacterium]
MCGIFAYFGSSDKAAEIVLKGLKKLEYRGYDSWGIAAKMQDGEVKIEKHVGKISEVINLNDELTKSAHLALGHSRWATHGGVTKYNAHPHNSANNEVVIAHNGIFENYTELKEELIGKGYKFQSETDTEVFAHLIADNLDKGFEEAFKLATKRVDGRYGVIAMCKAENKLIAARRGSPLIIGRDENGTHFIASDVPAFLEYTKEVMYLDDNEMVVIENNESQFSDLETGEKIDKRVVSIDWEVEEAEKGDYPHFMIKEIMDQKETLTKAINTDEEKIREVAEAIKNASETYFVGCGTSGKVAMAAEYLFANVAKKHVNVKFGSEFQSARHFLTEQSLIIAISQSGETADTLEAMEIAKSKGAKIVSIVNVETSTMARMSDIILPIKAGLEKAVASTKTTTSQLAIITLMAYALAEKLDEGKKTLIQAAGKINDMLNPRYEEHIASVAEKIKEASDIMVIGRDLNFPMALESAIKLQELSYIHAEGFAGGELKHGPIALIEEGTPCIVLVSNDDYKAEILSNAMEIKSRGGLIIGVAPENAEVFDLWIKVPDVGAAAPIVNIIPIQILSYKLALARQNNPDMPRNLAKSVTVK